MEDRNGADIDPSHGFCLYRSCMRAALHGWFFLLFQICGNFSFPR